MNCTCVVLVIVLAVLAWTGSAKAQSRLFGRRECAPDQCPPCLPAPSQDQNLLNPNAPQTAPDQNAQSPFNQALASAGEGGTQPTASFNPGFFGDFIGGGGHDSFTFNGVDIAQASGMKIAESDSPRPMDRFYYLYNGYANIDAAGTFLNRHIIGFEKTFLNGDASVGMRLPFFSLAGGAPNYPDGAGGFVGDLVVVTKYALINNRDTGNVLSGGMIVTAPTGETPLSAPGGAPLLRSYPVYFEPFVGYIYNFNDRLFVHAFHSVAIPTLISEPTFMSNDVGLGFWIYRDPRADLIRGVIPTLEIHVNTPFTQRSMNPNNTGLQTVMQDSVDLTAGFTIQLPRATIGGAVSIPLSYGPESIEALASVTMRF